MAFKFLIEHYGEEPLGDKKSQYSQSEYSGSKSLADCSPNTLDGDSRPECDSLFDLTALLNSRLHKKELELIQLQETSEQWKELNRNLYMKSMKKSLEEH